MTSNAAPRPPTTTIAKPYLVIECRITQGTDTLPQRVANRIPLCKGELNVPEKRLHARWNCRESKQEAIP